MFKKIFYIYLTYFFLISNAISNNNIFISTVIDDQIITNYDIVNETKYLKILNPSLSNLNENQLIKLARNSLIKEIIKKKEIIKLIEFDKKNPFVKEYLKNLYLRLNLSNEIEFRDFLIKKKMYSVEEIKYKIKVEVLWNELIFLKYGNQVKINRKEMSNKIDNINYETGKEFELSEIVFKKNKDEKLEDLIKKIRLSISGIGFNNTANIYSIAESSKFGGKIGWINQNNLSEKIFSEINIINEGDFTEVIQIGNNYLILKIEKIKEKKFKINKEDELKKMIQFETNKQLNQFSIIYFNKAKLNYSINEM